MKRERSEDLKQEITKRVKTDENEEEKVQKTS